MFAHVLNISRSVNDCALVAKFSRATSFHIITLQLLLQTRCEYCHPLLIAYVDLKASFVSVNQDFLWLRLLSMGLPPKLVYLFKALYTNTFSSVRADVCDSDWFLIGSGVRYINAVWSTLIFFHSCVGVKA